MTNYSSLSAEPKQFQALTAYTLAEFDALLPTFSDRFEAQMQAFTLTGKPRHRPMSAMTIAPCRRWRISCCSF